jgi:hypothetical protein
MPRNLIVSEATNRTEFVEQRREMLQTWAVYLDQLRSVKEALPPMRKRRRHDGPDFYPLKLIFGG